MEIFVSRRFVRRLAAMTCGAMLAAVLGTAIGGATIAASSTYQDPIGDASGAGLDVSTITVSDDAAGKITIHIDTPNATRTSVQQADNLQLYIDSDRNRATGTNGYDYRLALFGGGSPPFELDRWTGTEWVDTRATSFSGTFNNGVTFTVNKSDLGGSGQFEFAIITVDGSTGQLSDRAPDGALTERYTYPSTAPPPPKPRQHMNPKIVVPRKGFATSQHRLWFRALYLTGAPPAARAVFQWPRGNERQTANKNGRVQAKKLIGSRLRGGDVVRISLSKKGYFPCRLKILVTNNGTDWEEGHRSC